MPATSALLFAFLSLFAAQEPRVGDLVLRDLRCWTGPGEVSAPRTLLVQGGRAFPVEDLDSALRRAPGARVVVAEEDWILYPGLVHADFSTEFDAPEDSPYAERATDTREDVMPAMEYGARRALRGWLNAADVAVWKPEQGESWREAGFTTAHLVPKAGVLAGRSALVSLNDEPLGGALLTREGRVVHGLRGRGGYPGTPMAALALLRQLFLDADRARAGHGGRFESPDLAAVGDGIFLADSPRAIENVLDLLRDHAGGGAGSVVLGGSGAWKHAERLRAQGVGVVFVLDLDEAPKSDEELKAAAEDARPWWQAPPRLREELRREHAETVAEFRLLREAGVACALAPSGSPKAWREAAAQLVEDGLDPEELVAATSRDVLAVLGLASDPSAADFVVSRGAFDPADPDLAWVLAGGAAWEWLAEEEEPAATGDAAPAADGGSMAGDWLVSFDTPMGPQEFGMELVPAEGGVLLFDPKDPSGREEARDIRFRSDGVDFGFTPPDFNMPMELSVTLDAGSGRGTLKIPGMGAELPVEVERMDDEGGGPPAAAPPAGAQEEPAELAASDPDLGHPAWPVETRADRVPAHALAGEVLLRGGTLWTMTGAEPAVGDLLIRGGRITAVGGTVAPPEGVPVIEAAGWHLMPGIIDAHSHLALDSINEGSVAITAECRVGDMIHPEDLGIWRAAAGGTAVVQSLHGSANPVGGQAAVWELDYHAPSIAGLLVPDAMQGIKFALGENVKRSNGSGWGQRFPGSRAGVEAVYRRAFQRAQHYAEERAAFERGENPGFRRDVRLEVLAGVLANEIHIQCHGYRADELLMFLRVCEEFGIERPTFQHVLEGYKVAPEMAAAGAMGSTFSDWWAYKLEVIDAIPWNPALMQRAGVTASINSDSDEMIRRLNTEAGKALRYGRVGWQEAMAMCTTASAEQLRLEGRLGRLAPGYDGTVSVFDAPPLSTRARCVLTLARGRVLFERAAEHDARWAAYAEDAAAFAARLAATREGDTAGAPTAPADEAAWEPWIRAGRGRATLIRNARVHPVSAAPFDGEILIQDGRITWTGPRWEEPLPAGCEVVDAGGLRAYPGFLNAGDVTGLWEIGSLRASRDDAETGTDQPDLSVASAIHADSKHPRVTRLNGVTHVLARPTQGRIRGQAALIQLDGDSPEAMVTVPDLALCIAFPRARAPKPGKEPERPDAVDELDQWFDEALALGERIDRQRAAGAPLPPPDAKHEALIPFARGEKPVILEADDLWTLMAARQWAAERGLDAIYAGAQDAWKAAGHFGADGARLILGPVHALPRGEHDPFDAPYRNAGVLEAAGCAVTLRTANPEVTRNLPFQAATAATHGWSQEAALRAITLGAAEVLGVDRYTGSLEAGKAANLFLAEGDPMDFPGAVRRMWIGGREVELSSHQTELRDRYEARIDRVAAQD